MSEALKALLAAQLEGTAGDRSVTVNTPVQQSPEVIEMLRGRQEQADTNMMMAGASGALGELLFGGGGKTAQAGVTAIGGQMKRKQTLEDQELKYLMATQKAKQGPMGRSRAKHISMINPTSKKRSLGYWDPEAKEFRLQNGELATGWIQDYSEKVSKTNEGDLALISSGTDNPLRKVQTGTETEAEGISKGFKDHMDIRVVPQFEATIKADRDTLAELGNSLAMMKQGGVLPPMIALKSLAKALEGGKLTDKDFDIVMKPLSLKMSAREWAETQKTGVVPKRLRREYTQAVEGLLDIAKNRMREYADKRVMSQSRNDSERRALRKRLYGVMPDTTTRSDLEKRRKELLDKAGK